MNIDENIVLPTNPNSISNENLKKTCFMLIIMQPIQNRLKI